MQPILKSRRTFIAAATIAALAALTIGAVYHVYTGPRQFQAGQPVRVHVSDAGVFIL